MMTWEVLQQNLKFVSCLVLEKLGSTHKKQMQLIQIYSSFPLTDKEGFQNEDEFYIKRHDKFSRLFRPKIVQARN